MITKIFENVFKFEDQYFFGEKVNTYLIELDNKIILFDLPTFSKELKEEIKLIAKDKEILCILSHGSCGISDGTIWQKELGVKVYLHKNDTNHSWLRMQPNILFDEIPLIDSSVEIIHTPGHSDGSVCLIHHPSKTMFTGDSIYSKDGKTLVIDDVAELKSKSLFKFLDYDFKNIFPFHYLELKNSAKENLRVLLSKTLLK